MKSKTQKVQEWRDAQKKQLEEDTKGMTSLDRIHGVLQIHHIEGIIKGLDVALNILNAPDEEEQKYFLLRRVNCSNGGSDIIGITTDEEYAKSQQSVFCSYEELQILKAE
jgi:hypothetical protein